MQFSEVIGQKEIKESLVQMVQQNRLGHALLFLGKDGAGALPLAVALAQYIDCENEEFRKEKRDSCGICPSCRKMAQLIHPDVHFSYPVIPRKSGDKPVSTDYAGEWRNFIMQYPYGNVYDWLQFIGAENKQGNITAQECNEIIRKLSLKSFEGEYKILLMWMPEYLGQEGNKLLKLIEEPPDKTLFILVATDESLVLPTITSRTQLIKIPPLTREDIAAALSTQTSEEQALQVASVSEGNFREALQLSQHAEEDWLSLCKDWMNAILRKGPAAQVTWVDEISKLGRERQKQFLRYFNHLLEQAIRYRVLSNAGFPAREDEKIGSIISLPDNERDFVIRLNKFSTLNQQNVILEELDKATYYIERNAHAKMLFQALTIKFYHILSQQTIPVVL